MAVRGRDLRVVAEWRKRIAKRIKELQPEAQNTKIAAMLGVNESTVRSLVSQARARFAKGMDDSDE